MTTTVKLKGKTIEVEGPLTVFTQTEPMATSSHIGVHLVDPNPEQPREYFDEDELRELAFSIKDQGVIQPIIVEISEDGQRYTLHDGERRLRASKLCGLAYIPAYILGPGTDKKDLLIRATVANVQRADLSAIEEARAYQHMKDEFSLSDTDIAQAVGKNRATIANTRRLLQLPEAQQAQVNTGELSERQALALVPLYQLPQELQKKFSDHWAGKQLTNNPAALTSDTLRSHYKTTLKNLTHNIPWPIDKETQGNQILSLKCNECSLCIKVDNKDYGCADFECFGQKLTWAKCRAVDAAQLAIGIEALDPAQDYPYNKVAKFRVEGDNSSIALQNAIAHKCPSLRLYFSADAGTYYMAPDLEKYPGVIYACHHPNSQNCACKEAIENIDQADSRAAERRRSAAVSSLRDRTVNALAARLEQSPLDVLALLGRCVIPPYDKKYKKLLAAIANKEPDLVAGMVAIQLGTNQVPEYLELDKAYQVLKKWLTPLGLAHLIPPAAEPIEATEATE